MDLIITNSPVIPGGVEAGLASTGTYLPMGADSWYISTVGGEGGAIYLQHNGTGWELYSSYAVVIVQSSPVAITVPPWQATWPAPMIVSLDTYAPWGGLQNWLRLRLLEYV